MEPSQSMNRILRRRKLSLKFERVFSNLHIFHTESHKPGAHFSRQRSFEGAAGWKV